MNWCKKIVQKTSKYFTLRRSVWFQFVALDAIKESKWLMPRSWS